MDHRTLGRTGVHVSPLCLGAMMFGAWGNTDHEESIRIIHRALDAGINFIDTADVYCARRVRGDRRQGAQGRGATTSCSRRSSTARWATTPTRRGNSRRWIFREVEASLERLQTDWIDLYQVHRWDPWTDHEETLGALTDLVAQGKVRYIGSSTYPAAQIVKAQWVAERARPRALRLRAAALLHARARRSRTTCCRPASEYGMGVIPWSPLAGGWLSGQVAQGRRRRRPRARAALIPQRYDLSRPGQPGEARRRRRAGAARRRGRAVADPHGAGVRHPPPGGDRGDHRAAHDGAARVAARRGRRRADATTSSTASTRSSRPGRPSTRVDAGWTNPALEPSARRR